jgi:hypothetical protein
MTAEWTKDDVKAIAPEFATLDDATLDRYIGWAFNQVNPCAFKDRTPFAGALMTAHLLTVLPSAGGVGGTTGPVVSRSVGGVSVTYGAVALQGAATVGLDRSKYGIQFAQLASVSAGAMVL